VTNFAAQQWATDLALPLLTKIRGKKVFVPTGFSGLFHAKYQAYYIQMKKWLKEYDKVVYLSENYRDANFAEELGLTNGILIPNGASEEEFSIEKDTGFRKRFGIPANNLLVLHVSGYVGGKGHMDAFRIFSKANLKQATLLFVSPDFGRKFNDYQVLSRSQLTNWVKNLVKHSLQLEYPQLKLISLLQSVGFYRNICFIELNRVEVIQAYKNADLFLFPSNIECSPIVLFECMAAETPFLVTNVGNAKEIVDWSHAGQILPTISINNDYGYGKALIQKSSKLLYLLANDLHQRRKMSEEGYNMWKKNFTWRIIAKQYEDMYLDLIIDLNIS
ncbi:MAG: hypothetical protein C0412_22115, partial [Flavobacterium sp.]|nr:hypothetical protein [Flavobacterium sp.]